MYIASQESAIRERAYAIWEQEGRPAGREWDHWDRASREVMSPTPASAPSVAAPETAIAAAKTKSPTRKSPSAKTRIRQAIKSAIS